MRQTFLAALMFGLLISRAAFAQHSLELDRSTMDRIFPLQGADTNPRSTIMIFVLRYWPGLDPALGAESRIKVTIEVGEAPVVEYDRAERRLSTVLDEMIQVNPLPDPDEVARRMKITRKAIKVSGSQALKWQKDMLGAVGSALASLPPETKRTYETGTAYLTLDGSAYEIWYSSGLTSMLYNSDQDSAFVKWADHFRSEVALAAK